LKKIFRKKNNFFFFKKIETCDISPCKNQGICVSQVCVCKPTFFGRFCESQDASSCDNIACFNGGFCVPGNNSNDPATCDCTGTSYQGAQCETKIDPCASKTCLNGASCASTGDKAKCLCPPLFLGSACEVELLTLIFIPLGVLIVLIVYIILNRWFPQADNLVVVTISLGLYDFITDCLFAASQGEKDILIPVVVFLAIPILFNLGTLLFALFKTFKSSPGLEKWLEENYGIAAGGILLASTNIECFLLLTSNLFYSEKFRAPLEKEWIRLLFVLGIIGNVLEDIPQLILQGYAAGTQGVTTLVLVSIVASVLSLGFSLIKRAIFYLLFRFGSLGSSSSSGAHPGTFHSDLNEHLLVEQK